MLIIFFQTNSLLIVEVSGSFSFFIWIKSLLLTEDFDSKNVISINFIALAACIFNWLQGFNFCACKSFLYTLYLCCSLMISDAG